MDLKQHNRKFLMLTLMGSSILLLLLLQFLWIRSEYRAAEDSFRKETNLVFKHTVSDLIDSLFMTRVEILRENDSTVHIKRMHFPRPELQQDSALQAIRRTMDQKRNRSVIIFSNDSTNRFTNTLRSKRKAFMMLRLDPDSLDVESLSNKYRSQLMEIGRNVGFKVVKKDAGKITDRDNQFRTEFIHIGPRSPIQYAAIFERVKPILLKELYPQIIFSLVLTLLIAAAFILLFKNLQMQQRLITQKDDFINNVSHELKTPIATINVALEAFKNFKVMDNPRLTGEYLDIVKNELDRLSAMTDRILNAAVYENKGIDIDAEKVDFKEITTQVLSSMKVIRDNENIAVDMKSSGSDFNLSGSREHLTNIVHNLLDNAAKYSPRPAHISVALREEGQFVTLQIADNGIGIPGAYQQKVFEKFFRVPNGDIHNVKGYGLGLHYVAQVVKAHKGSVAVESTPGKGSTFTVKLPKSG